MFTAPLVVLTGPDYLPGTGLHPSATHTDTHTAPHPSRMARSHSTLFNHQMAAFDSARAPDARARTGRLKALRQHILDNRKRIQAAIHEDFRKPRQEVDTTEILPLLLEIDHAVRRIHTWMKPVRRAAPLVLGGASWEVRREPKGPSLIISPWNYPITLSLGPLVHALAAGCPVFIKPSELTPATSSLVQNLTADLFGPEEVVTVLGGAETAQELLRLPFRHVFFTGSTRVGKLVMAAAAEHLASVTLELGGKSPAVVAKDADMEAAAERIAFGKWANAGQTCIAPDYILVHEEDRDALVAQLVDQISRRFGETAEERALTPDYARLISRGHTNRMQELIMDATRRGARLAFGGRIDTEERYAEPALLLDVTPDARIMQEEIFGPLLPVVTYRSESDIVAQIGALAPPLSIYVFSRSEDLARTLGERVRTGATSQNDTLVHFANPHVPFGGLASSGVGRTHGESGFLAFTNEQTAMRRRVGGRLGRLLAPPWTPRKTRLLEWLLRM